ncbi:MULTISPECIES: YfcC family protein [unclassified Clostridioides]|uniref:YfcC family protein n=1 Tax=unclassified Clostridioides TaxID=2635829 RepID=UPI0006BBB0F0|nr:C4-dicarboxylate ABC transporter [Clostridioides difficile]MCC0692301.1 YfcC family protein [Clostridioides sp. ZZV14-6387]MDB3083240.1 YfcC family protein [Clostridioides difficile]MDI7817663.1 YfcC family protein [Clostridioides difficile]NJI79880.1 YfcC family protein [Clostridioides difficile]
MTNKTEGKKRKLSFPDAYVLMIGLIIFAAIMTYIVPSGTYNRVEDLTTGNMLVQAGSFKYGEQHPVSIMDVFRAIPSGLGKNSVTVFFVLIIGGAFGIVNSTGSLDALIGRVISKSQGSKKGEIIITCLVLTFGLAGGVVGMYEECIAFLPILMTLCIALGYDALVAAGILLLGLASGYGSATINPFTVGLAQGISGLPLFSGMWFRWIFWICTMILLSTYIIFYCKKIKKDPSKSLVADIDYSHWQLDKSSIKEKLSAGNIRVLVTFFGGILALMILIVKFSLSMSDLSAYFFALGILCGVVYGMSPNKIASGFVKGMQEMVYPAILIGFASSIVVILEQGVILDSIVHGLSLVLNYVPRIFSGGVMMIMQSVINFFIPSGTGQAMVTMPLMAPLADVIGIPRQVAVLAYQMGDGFANGIVPTLGVLMAGISIAHVPYTRWFKFASKIILMELALGFIFLMIAVQINLGPF